MHGLRIFGMSVQATDNTVYIVRIPFYNQTSWLFIFLWRRNRAGERKLYAC
jgi:hypothetical protein